MKIVYSQDQKKLPLKQAMIFIAAVLSILLIARIIYTSASPNKSTLQLCQESYMESLNNIYEENRKTTEKCIREYSDDIYKLNVCTSSPLGIPKNTCGIEQKETKENISIGTVAPANTGVPPKSNITEYLNNLHAKVCKKQSQSPLCKDKELFIRLYYITEERIPNKNWFPIMLGIINAESSLGINFNPRNCGYTNNWGGVKWKKTDNGTSVRDQKIPDKNGCWLYSFNTVEDFWISKTNTFKFGYKGCIDSQTPLACISKCYVRGDCRVIKYSWVNNASIFLN